MIFILQKGVESNKNFAIDRHSHGSKLSHSGAMTDCENELCCHMQNGKGPQGKRAGYLRRLWKV